MSSSTRASSKSRRQLSVGLEQAAAAGRRRVQQAAERAAAQARERALACGEDMDEWEQNYGAGLTLNSTSASNSNGHSPNHAASSNLTSPTTQQRRRTPQQSPTRSFSFSPSSHSPASSSSSMNNIPPPPPGIDPASWRLIQAAEAAGMDVARFIASGHAASMGLLAQVHASPQPRSHSQTRHQHQHHNQPSNQMRREREQLYHTPMPYWVDDDDGSWTRRRISTRKPAFGSVQAAALAQAGHSISPIRPSSASASVSAGISPVTSQNIAEASSSSNSPTSLTHRTSNGHVRGVSPAVRGSTPNSHRLTLSPLRHNRPQTSTSPMSHNAFSSPRNRHSHSHQARSAERLNGADPRAHDRSRTPLGNTTSSISSASSSSSSYLNRPLSGRSTYDVAGVLRLRVLQRETAELLAMAQQEREENEKHEESINNVIQKDPALKPFVVTRQWIAASVESQYSLEGKFALNWAGTPKISSGPNALGQIRAECGICLDTFRLGARIQQLPCSHAFHSKNCLTPWLQRSSVCPMCRYDLKKKCTAQQAELREQQERKEQQDFQL